jgi:small subunit ribosomal protein S11
VLHTHIHIYPMLANFLSATRGSVRQFSTFPALKNAAPTFGEAVKNPSKLNANKPTKAKKEIVTVKNVLHCNFLKNNTFLTLTRVQMDTNWKNNNSNATFNEAVLYYLTLPQKLVLSQSTGYLGFRKAQRGEYEASFQLSSHIFKTIKDKELIKDSGKLEIIVRGFGKGRAAFFDALKGKEGTGIREHICRLSDLTPIAFGGNRAPSRRRI